VVYQELADSGHWVHVDNPEGLLTLMQSALA
jgi:pimeloyl-ACP methyl ester carboxylesterase